MTLDEAHEAGELAQALDCAEASIRRADSYQRDNAGMSIGVGLSINHSDSGSDGLGPDVIVPASMACAVMCELRDQIISRLTELGVDTSKPRHSALNDEIPY